MDARGFVTISMHELERVKIIEAVVERLVIRYRAKDARPGRGTANITAQRYITGSHRGKRTNS